MSVTPTPLNPLELRLRSHAILCTVGFLILLPIGVLVPRLTRTLPYKWFYVHSFIQFVVALPVIAVGWSLGYKTNLELQTPRFQDPHEKIGLVLLILYLTQLAVGASVHFFKFPTLFRGHRAPHNYLHVLIGFSIIILAQFQVHYGLYTEWNLVTGGVHPIPPSAKHAWLALVVVFWALYIGGMLLIPRQFKQEKENRNALSPDVQAKVDA